MFSNALKAYRMIAGIKVGPSREPAWVYPICPRQPGDTECGYYVMLYIGGHDTQKGENGHNERTRPPILHLHPSSSPRLPPHPWSPAATFFSIRESSRAIERNEARERPETREANQRETFEPEPERAR
ncbi:hypothetical protein K1719_005927 [Acacia pycnantha]|nr:hypothetical protein K1719_005927 [Acacia pycnantha]